MIKLLVKNRLRGFIAGLLRSKEGNSKKTAGKAKPIAFGLIFAVLFLCFISLTLTFAIPIASALVPLGFSWLYFAIFLLAEFSILFIFSIFETKSELFDCKDNDLLLSMPIKGSELLLSRVIVVLLINYALESLFMIPAAVVYATVSGDALGTVGFIAVSLFIPPLATALSSGVGFLVALLMKKIRNTTFITMLASISFLVLYFWGYNALVSGMDKLFIDFDPSKITGNLAVLEFIGGAALLKPLNAVVFVIASSVVSFAAYYVISLKYINILGIEKGKRRIKYQAKTAKNSGALFALTRKEFSKFFSSALYMLNAGLGLVFVPVLAVALIFYRDTANELAQTLVPMYKLGELAGALGAPVIIMMFTMITVSAAALSLEGKSFYILKSLPIPPRTVLLSKILPQIIMCSVVSLVSAVIIGIAFSVPLLYWVFLLLMPFFASVSFSALGLIFNVLLPNFDFENEAQPIKQSLAVTFALFGQMIIGLAEVAGAILLLYFKGPLVSALVLLSANLLFALITLSILLFRMDKRYSRL